MKEDRLTIKKLKALKPDTIFAKGYGKILHPWFNDAKNIDKDNLTKVKWVAIRGGIYDWAIYHSMDANLEPADYFDGDTHLKASWERIARHGAKLHDMEKVLEFVPCTKKALLMYRH